MRIQFIFLAALCAFGLQGCFVYNYLHYEKRKISSLAQPISHQGFSLLLQKHVSPTGKVDYQGFIRDSVEFRAYLQLLNSHHPNESNWNSSERLAYWINAYNAYTIELICKNYPLQSIKDLEKGLINLPFANSVWDIEFIQIESQKYTLNYLEHKILRKEFNEPRIHFAINCASESCPALRPEAYLPERIDEQLQEQAILFINDGVRNKISAERAELSKIFSWFKPDFTKKGSLRAFINQYAKQPIGKKTKLEFLDYSWKLNGD